MSAWFVSDLFVRRNKCAIILFSSGGCEETVDPHNERFSRRHVIIWGFGLSCCASAEEKKLLGLVQLTSSCTVLLYLCVDPQVCYICTMPDRYTIFITSIPRSEGAGLYAGMSALVWSTCSSKLILLPDWNNSDFMTSFISHTHTHRHTISHTHTNTINVQHTGTVPYFSHTISFIYKKCLPET